MTRKTTERIAKKDDGVIYNLVVGGEKVKVKRKKRRKKKILSILVLWNFQKKI